jgi:aspartate/methionine/tyrosine aminotransferase
VFEAAARAGAAAVVDQVFWPFALDTAPPPAPPPPAAPAATLAERHGVLAFTLDGVSKRLAAPGVKLGWIRLDGPETQAREAADQLDRIADVYLSVSAASAAALPALLGLEEETVGRARHRTWGNLEELRRRWPGRVRRCGAGWVAVVDAPRTEGDLALRLLRDCGLAVHPGWFYGVPGDSALVVSLLPRPEEFAAGAGALAAAVGD